jgi:XTP/dITP diphosphohydrolase
MSDCGTELMPKVYVLASGNPGKLREFSEILSPLGLVVQPQSDWQTIEAKETATTFVENALDKARNAAGHTGLPSIGDDSGLVVPSLQGEPGIFSARYAGEDSDDQANVNKLLAQMEQRSGTDRRAYFYCALALVQTVDDPAPLIATARWHGHILRAPQGNGGFGYDPVFAATGSRLSTAELTTEQKHRISHRGQALAMLLSQLRELDESTD